MKASSAAATVALRKIQGILNSGGNREEAAAIAKKAYNENTTLKEAAVSLGLLTPDEFDAWVKPEDMISGM